MLIGKQSTLNDLANLAAELEVVKAIKLIEATPFANGNLGEPEEDIFDNRPNGVYHINQSLGGVYDNPAFSGVQGDKNGMMIHMTPVYGSAYSAAIFAQWDGSLSLLTSQAGTTKNRVGVLTNKNTITDSNGFIKAA